MERRKRDVFVVGVSFEPHDCTKCGRLVRAVVRSCGLAVCFSITRFRGCTNTVSENW